MKDELPDIGEVCGGMGAFIFAIICIAFNAFAKAPILRMTTIGQRGQRVLVYIFGTMFLFLGIFMILHAFNFIFAG